MCVHVAVIVVVGCGWEVDCALEFKDSETGWCLEECGEGVVVGVWVKGGGLAGRVECD